MNTLKKKWQITSEIEPCFKANNTITFLKMKV